MKIVVTVHTYWPARNGVQYVTQYLCEGLAAKGHDVTVITVVPNPEDTSREEHNGVHIIRAYLKTMHSFFNYGEKEYVRLVKEETKSADALINCCVQAPNNNVLLPVLREINAFKLLYMHGMHEFKLPEGVSVDTKYKLWHAFMNVRWRTFYSVNKKNFSQYDAIVDIHETSPGLAFMRSLGVDANQYIITNAVEDFSTVTVSQNDIITYPVLGEKFFLDVANFNDRKNQMMLVEAFRGVSDNKGAKLVLIGGNSNYCDSLKSKVSEYGLNERILVFENQDREITKKFIRNCLCGVMSSRFEVYPIFLCEVISCDHPYISTDVGCVKDIPGGDIACSTEEFSRLMQIMLEDEVHRTELSEKGLSFAIDHLSQQAKIDQLERILMSNKRAECN